MHTLVVSHRFRDEISKLLIFSSVGFFLLQLSSDYFRLVLAHWPETIAYYGMNYGALVKISGWSYFASIVFAALSIDRIKNLMVLRYLLIVYNIIYLLSAFFFNAQSLVISLVSICCLSAFISVWLVKLMLDNSDKTMRLLLTPLYIIAYFASGSFAQWLQFRGFPWMSLMMVFGSMIWIPIIFFPNAHAHNQNNIEHWGEIWSLFKNKKVWFAVLTLFIVSFAFATNQHLRGLVYEHVMGVRQDSYFFVMSIFLAFALGTFFFSFVSLSGLDMRVIISVLFGINAILFYFLYLHYDNMQFSWLAKDIPIVVFLSTSLIYYLFQNQSLLNGKGNGFALAFLLAVIYIMPSVTNGLFRLLTLSYRHIHYEGQQNLLSNEFYISFLIMLSLLFTVWFLPIKPSAKLKSIRKRILVYYRRAMRRRMSLINVVWGLHLLGAVFVASSALLFASFFSFLSLWGFVVSLIIGFCIFCIYQLFTSFLIFKNLCNARTYWGRSLAAMLGLFSMYQFVPVTIYLMDLLVQY